MGALLKYEHEFYWQDCCACGITFGFAAAYDKELRKTHKNFYCPNGHQQAYIGENEEQRLRKELAAEKERRERAEREREWAQAQSKNDRIQRTKAQNKLTRITARVNAGVCPHCNRTFKQLAAHMRTKHPNVAPTSLEPVDCNHGDAA